MKECVGEGRGVGGRRKYVEVVVRWKERVGGRSW